MVARIQYDDNYAMVSPYMLTKAYIFSLLANVSLMLYDILEDRLYILASIPLKLMNGEQSRGFPDIQMAWEDTLLAKAWKQEICNICFLGFPIT